jgi:dual oxidase
MHIRAVGPWTKALRVVFDPKKLKDHPMPFLYLDGPYGEGHQDWSKYETAILVGGGIGVTPFASILKDVVFQIQYNHTLPIKKVYFFWVCRSQRGFEWLIDIIRDLEEKDAKGILEVHIFITELLHKFDLRTTMLYICEHQFQKISNRSIFTGLAAATHFGRPSFADLFGQLQAGHAPTAKIGVFTCGPVPMTNNVEEACVVCNEYDGARFYHHFENF